MLAEAVMPQEKVRHLQDMRREHLFCSAEILFRMKAYARNNPEASSRMQEHTYVCLAVEKMVQGG